MRPCTGICILTEAFFPIVGGAETHARLLSDNLLKMGNSVLVITRRSARDLQRYEYVGDIPVYRVWPYGLKRWGKYLWLLPAAIRLFIIRHRYDIIYVCGLRIAGALGVIAGIILRKKCILRAESCGELSGDFIWSRLNLKTKFFVKILIGILLLIRNLLLRRADYFLSISKAIREEYLKYGVQPDKIVEIPNGIDTSKFKPVDEETRQRLRRKLGIPLKTIFAYTGKLNKGKGLEMLLRVWDRMVSERDDIHLVLVGAGDYQFLSCEKELRAYVDQTNMQDFVTFTGYVEHVHEYLQCSDYFIFASESEALGISLIEALSCELPSIATNVGGIVDIIKPELNGKLIEINDERQLYESIIEFLASPDKAKKLGEKGRKYVLNHFSIQDIAAKHFNLFRT